LTREVGGGGVVRGRGNRPRARTAVGGGGGAGVRQGAYGRNRRKQQKERRGRKEKKIRGEVLPVPRKKTRHEICLGDRKMPRLKHDVSEKVPLKYAKTDTQKETVERREKIKTVVHKKGPKWWAPREPTIRKERRG